MPFAPGGSSEIVARATAAELGKLLGQSVYVDNKPGGASVVGASIAAKSPPDGYTLLLAPTSFGINPALHAKLPYDPIRDFAPISLVALLSNVLTVHPSLPVKTVPEFVRLAKARPGAINFGSSGASSPAFLQMTQLMQQTNTRMTEITYKGAAPAVNDIVGEQVQMVFLDIPVLLPQVQAGKIAALAVTSAQRSAVVPDIPALSEVLPGFDIRSWTALVGPAKLPPAVVERERDRLDDRRLAREQTDAKSLRRGHLRRRLGDGPEVGRAIAFLASPACPFITGANLVVDGGMTVRAG